MLKILNTGQIKDLDAYTIRHEPVASIDLMERACRAFAEWFVARFDATQRVGIVCGTGNNGGDGLGIARLLTEWSYSVKVWIVRGQPAETADFKVNLNRLDDHTGVSEFPAKPAAEIFSDRDILIDAIFGSGLSRPAEGIYATAIDAMNASSALRVAVDVPSGLFADKHSSGSIVRADHTVSFQLPKLAFVFPENHPFVGAWHLVDIGLSRQFIREAPTPYFFLRKKDVKKLLKPRSAFDHKGNFGKALLIAGSHGKMGACVLGARAALRAGIGLLTVHVPAIGYTILQSAVPEAMVSTDSNSEVFSVCPDLHSYDAIGLGPGLGQADFTTEAVAKVLAAGKPMVIDADALNILGSHKELIESLPAGCILTPHPKEFERLVGAWKDDFERMDKQTLLAKQTKCIVVLKGAHTAIATPDGQLYFNSTGNPGMATGGSGDVLTGILTGLLGQNYTPTKAAVLGVFLHGLSGDLAVREMTMTSLIASDLIDFLPAAFREL